MYVCMYVCMYDVCMTYVCMFVCTYEKWKYRQQVHDVHWDTDKLDNVLPRDHAQEEVYTETGEVFK